MPKKSKKAAKPVDPDNPEDLPSIPNTLFYEPKSQKAKPAKTADEAPTSAPAAKEKKRPQSQVVKSDPAAHLVHAEKKRKREDAAAGKSAKAAPAARGERPHAEAVEQSNKLWERLRAEKTGAAERAKLIDEVLALFSGKTISVLQKHDAARVLQSCFKQGSAAQRDAMMSEIRGEARTLARSHYGHFLLVCVVRHGTPAHKAQLVAELRGHAAELMVHAEGSAVLQLLYADVASGEQKAEMYREMWGKDMVLFGGDAASLGSLDELFEHDPLCKSRVLRRMEILLSKAARKGLAVTALVQKGAADLLKHGDAAQRSELVASFREQAVHIMHTRDGARIACGCLRFGDAKDRKALLKGMKGYVARAALDPHGALVACVALEAVDDTVLLSKAVLSELLAELPQLAMHAHGSLPLLQLLAPRSTRYFTSAQLGIMGEIDSVASKKDPNVRRAELLPGLLPALVKLGEAQPVQLACSPHGGAVLYETARVAADGTQSVDVAPLLAAIAAAALSRPAAEDGAEAPPLVAHPYAARLIKRLVQEQPAFAEALLPQLSGKLLKWAKEGAGWVVLALLECEGTSGRVRAELKGSAEKIGKCAAAGCKSLHEALRGKK